MAIIRFIVFTIAVVALASSFAHASDPSPLQDFCVAVNDSMAAVFVNGKICKNPKQVVANDFLFRGLNMPGNTSNPLGSKVTPVNVNNLPGLNTLGISLARIDFAPNGLNPPHTHPRATEVLVLLEGTLYVGFVLSNPPPGMKNPLFTKTLVAGDFLPENQEPYLLLSSSPVETMDDIMQQNPYGANSMIMPVGLGHDEVASISFAESVPGLLSFEASNF
nr:germin-like protein subfamily 1 member 13 [Ipomoea batatas]